MNKGELVDTIAATASIPKKTADATLTATIEAIVEAVAAGNVDSTIRQQPKFSYNDLQRTLMKRSSTITRIILSWTGVKVAAILVFQPAFAQTPSHQACKGAINQPSQSSQMQRTWWMKDQPGTSRAFFYPTSTPKTKDSRPNGFNPVQSKRYTRNNLNTALAAFRACQLEQLRKQQANDKKD